MPFLNQRSDGKKMIDKVFKAAVRAHEAKLRDGAEHVVDATLGTLFDDTGQFIAYDSVWDEFDQIDHITKARYAASIQGNPSYQNAVRQWLFADETMPASIIATPGGAGAVAATIKNVLDPGSTVIKPSLGWGPYKTMAVEAGMRLRDYNMFQADHFDLDDFFAVCTDVMTQEGKVLAILNDPCHNPSGYTLDTSEWDDLIDGINELAEQGPVVLLHDIAYVDYNNDPHWKRNLLRYRDLHPNAMVVIAFSLSKTLTAYGMRVGAAVAITSDDNERQRFTDAMIYSARSIWSTVNNAAMELFARITSDEHRERRFLAEKQAHIAMIQQRAAIFVTEAERVGLDLYPYREGFFATIRVDERIKESLNEWLAAHNIFLVEVAGGLRVALCSVPKTKLFGLAERIQFLISQYKKDS